MVEVRVAVRVRVRVYLMLRVNDGDKQMLSHFVDVKQSRVAHPALGQRYYTGILDRHMTIFFFLHHDG